MKRSPMLPRRAGLVAVSLVGVGCVFAAGASIFSNNAPAPSMSLSETSDMDSVWSAGLLSRTLAAVGIAPETLAASGVAANQVSDVVSRARVYLAEHGNTLQSCLDDSREAKASCQALERRVRTGVSSEQERSAYASASTTRSSTDAARATALESFFQAATAGLAAERVTALRNLQANRTWEVPIQYRAVSSRTEAQWVALREALAHVRITDQAGDEPSSDAESLVQSADADNTVISAASGLQNLDAITTAWNTAVE